MRIRKIFVTVAVMSVLSFMSVSALANHYWGNYHWARSGNLSLDLGANVNSTWDGHLELASIDWSKSKVLNTTVVAGSTSPRQCRAQTGNVQVCNLSYGNNGWLGIAGISISGDHITAGYVKLNDTYFDTAQYNTDDWRQLVACQEVGHTFGLGHQDENFNNANLGTCMDYTSDPLKGGVDNTAPNSHDYDLLETIYAHDDSGGGGGGGGGGCNPKSPKCNQGASAAEIMGSMNANGPAQWGRLVSGHGPIEVYEMDLGGGRKILTHVTWTLERANDHEH